MPKKEEEKKKKAQSAMEFILTYGWAIIVVMVVLSALYFVGVFNPKTSSNCVITTPFICKDFIATDVGVTYTIGSTGVDTAVITDIKINGKSCETPIFNGGLGGKIYVSEEEGKIINPKIVNQVSCKGIILDKNQKISSKIEIEYSKIVGGIMHDVEGSASSGVVETATNHPPTIILTSPTNGKEVDIPVTLTWEGNDIDGDSLTYDVYLNGNLVGKCQDTSEKICVLNESDLEYGAQYTWYVIVSDGKEEPVQSDTWSFTTGQNALFEGTVLLMHLDDGAGATTFEDDSGQGNDGSCTGNKCPTWVAEGKVGGAYIFNGSSNFISHGNVESLNFDKYSNFTLSAWFKMGTGGYRGIVSKSNGIVGGNYGYTITTYTSTNQLLFGIVGGGTNYMLYGITTAITYDQWHHMVASYSYYNNTARNMLMYIDGVLKGTKIIPANVSYSSTNAFKIGYGQGYFNGTIDEVYVWNRVLDANEISLLYNL